jgi:cyclopropane fatty-acyl-phospholipid synthase-like methyltransferase
MHKALSLHLNREKQRKIYQKLTQKYADNHKSLHWSSEEVQFKRYEILIKDEVVTQNKSLLDIGCGKGDVLHYLDMLAYCGAYTGLDLVDELLELAKNKFSNQAHFSNKDFLSKEFNSKYDVIIASGLFAFGNQALFENIIRKAYLLCNDYVAFNLFDAINTNHFFSIKHNDVMKFLKCLEVKRIETKSGYLKGDRTYFLYKL